MRFFFMSVLRCARLEAMYKFRASFLGVELALSFNLFLVLRVTVLDPSSWKSSLELIKNLGFRSLGSVLATF